jgi:hypothetical protein
MQHLTRWRTVTAAATTAALAAGAFGIANAVSTRTEQPSAIELTSGAARDDLAVVEDGADDREPPDSQVSVTNDSVSQPSPATPPSPASVDSPAEAGRSAVTERPATTTRDLSADSPDSPDSPPSPASPPSPDSPSSPASPPSPDSPSSVDSVSSVSS